MLELLITVACFALACAGCAYSIATAWVVRGFVRRSAAGAVPSGAGVSVVKPLHGAEPGLLDNLRSFLEQDHAGPLQLLCGIADPNDAARGVVERLIETYPDRDIRLVVGSGRGDGNAKIANLAAMSASIAHDLVLVSDSDIRVDRDYVARTCEALEHDGIGLVTCLYRGGSASGLWSRLATMAIDYHFLPSVLLGVRLGKAHPCMGATMAFRRRTLDAIGGFRAFSQHLADDYAIGAAVRGLGLRVVLARHVVEHRCNEASGRELFLHELRWARTVRRIDPRGYLGSMVCHPLPFALIAIGSTHGNAASIALLAATLACRGAVQWQVERPSARTRRWLLGPVRDVLSFVVFCATFLSDVVTWRGRRYRIRVDGTMAEIGDPFNDDRRRHPGLPTHGAEP